MGRLKDVDAAERMFRFKALAYGMFAGLGGIPVGALIAAKVGGNPVLFAILGFIVPVLAALGADTGRHLIATSELFSVPGMVERWQAAAPALLDESAERDSATPGVGVRDSWVPFGLVGVISPWNFPVNLAIAPMASALAAGNRVMIKPSEFTPPWR